MSGANLQAARLNSLAVLVVAYVGLSFASAQHDRLGMLLNARRAVADILLSLEDHGVGPNSGLGDVRIETRKAFSAASEPHKVLTVNKRDGRWAVPLPRSWEEANTASTANTYGYAELRDVAAEFRVDIPKEEDFQREYVRVYQDIEAKASEGVEVPGTGVRFLGTKAVWASAFFVAGLLIVMRDRLQRVLAKPDATEDERWLALDGRKGLERILATGELLALLFAPSALTASLLLIITSQLMADGAASSVVSDAVTGALSLSLLVVNAWVSLTTVSLLLALRQRRRG